jgi:N-acetylneuraminic acid mutarotase
VSAPTIAAAGTWTAPTTATLPVAGSWFDPAENAVLLPDASGDRVLVAGGSDGTRTGALSAAARYNPSDSTWTALPDLKAARRRHTVTALPGGTVLVVGGLPSGAQFPAPGLPSAEVCDPRAAQPSWTLVASMAKPRWGHSAVLLKDGKKVLVTGGTTQRSGSSEQALATAELYDVEERTWKAAEPMTDARSGHASVLLGDGRVLVVGGSVPIRQDDHAALAHCEIYDPATGKWSPAGTLNEPRRNHQAVLVGTTVLAIGGSAPGMTADGGFDPFSRRTTERYDVSAGKWSMAQSLPGGRSFHRAVALGTTKVLVVGGTGGARSDTGYENAVLFDTGTGAWTAAGSLATGRWAVAATALSDGNRVVVTGGIARAGLTATDPAVAELTSTTEVFTLGGAA